ncbi:RidA family protein [Acinetobacter puyangensis]|uniref:RidA family protein n=1 Tax=Acinetobacter puyangensis TaxID=1096779 RepID=UPI003A4DBEC6
MTIDIKRFYEGTRASQVVISGPRIETSGLVARCLNKGVTEQTACVLQQLEQLMQDVGSDKKHITRIQIWLADMADFDAMNIVYDAWVSDIHKPVRACVGAQLASPEYLIEIQATAVLY